MKAIVCIMMVVLTLTWIDESHCLSCLQCDGNQQCATLPDNCEAGRRACGCCDECKGKVGDKCNNFSVQCESGLVCRNADGKEKPAVYWYDFNFKGTCQEPFE